MFMAVHRQCENGSLFFSLATTRIVHSYGDLYLQKHINLIMFSTMSYFTIKMHVTLFTCVCF